MLQDSDRELHAGATQRHSRKSQVVQQWLLLRASVRSRRNGGGFLPGCLQRTEQRTWVLPLLGGSCLVVRCDTFRNQLCALQPSISNTLITKAELSADFSSEKIYPAVSNTHFRLAPKAEWDTITEGSTTTLKFHNDAHKPVLKIALYGRKYSSDPPYIPFY
ncbi:hypothetical protein JTE90_019672 [Oedothorax gibbosus]|uniref:Vanin C-terminal domain-containing protein n=1 Tax=Oedothorax gibbosus TaxID=931172 RepID=A0AAV6UZP7_9ARAC|nr:hypothetical protein JTE90_019672 [Oedothorax gibbosus]